MSKALYSRDILRLAVSIPHQERLPNPDATAQKRSKTCGSQVTVDVVISSELQLELLKNIFPHLQGKEVILLGDGEFDSNDVIDWLENQLNWRYVCRTATNIKIFDEEEWLSLSELSIPDKEEAFFSQVLFTQEASVGPINIVALWDEEDSRHIFFVTNMETLEEAREW
jgi:hypothetical protein